MDKWKVASVKRRGIFISELMLNCIILQDNLATSTARCLLFMNTVLNKLIRRLNAVRGTIRCFVPRIV
jgi:hypothetical protein